MFVDVKVDAFNWKALAPGEKFSADNPLRIQIGDSNAPLCEPGWYVPENPHDSHAMSIQMVQLAPKLWELLLAPSPAAESQGLNRR